MAKSNQMQMPGAFGGLMRYDEEYRSRFMISPKQVIAFIVGIIVLVLILKLIFPTPTSGIAAPVPSNIPLPTGHGFILSLLSF